MFGRITIVAALVLFAITIGCMVWQPSDTPGSKPDPADNGSVPPATGRTPVGGLPYRGVAMQIQRMDWMDKYKQSMDEIAALGADTVSLVIDTRQENVRSIKIYLDMRMTPTDAQLTDLIRHAKSKNLRVVLMPIVLLDNPGNDWRGTLTPENWDNWFESYTAMMERFAYIAQGTGVDVLVVGSELVSSQEKDKLWRVLIRQIRQIYKGQLTYSSNWDRYQTIKFWDQLDLIGMNSYWKLGKDNTVQVAEIEGYWREIQGALLPFIKEQGKPLLFLEAGWCSLSNAAHEPWDYTRKEHPVDLELQKRMYEAFFNAWHGNPLLGGFMMWEWSPGDPDWRNEDYTKGYTPEGKPAEKVLREWLAKPRWEVR